MHGSKRDDWEFVYTITEVAEAADTKANYHAQRRYHWQDERDKAEAELREKGIEFRAHEVTGGKRVQAVIDPERQNHLDNCESKIRDHQRREEEYSGYSRALTRAADREADDAAALELTIADILFFGLDELED